MLSAASIEVPEDGEATYTVTLATQPTGPVIVTFSGVTSTDPSPGPEIPHLHRLDLEHGADGDADGAP